MGHYKEEPTEGSLPTPHVDVLCGLQGEVRRLGGHLRISSRLAGRRRLGRGQLLLESQGRNLQSCGEVSREYQLLTENSLRGRNPTDLLGSCMEAKKNPGQVSRPICPSSLSSESGLELAMSSLDEAISLRMVGRCHHVTQACLSAEGGPCC
jgi:hypothetical protein